MASYAIGAHEEEKKLEFGVDCDCGLKDAIVDDFRRIKLGEVENQPKFDGGKKKHRIFVEKQPMPVWGNVYVGDLYYEDDVLTDYSDDDEVLLYGDNDSESDVDNSATLGHAFRRSMNREELKEYHKQMEKTLGFDIDLPKNVLAPCGVAVPYSAQELEPGRTLDLLISEAKLALDGYNRDNEADLKFVKVVKANAENCCGVDYITFEAERGHQSRETFQAKVNFGFDETDNEVEFCRIKP